MEDEELDARRSSSWSAIEGSLYQSLKVVEDSEDAIYTAGPTSKLVLQAPSPPDQSLPCELTVTFQQKLCHVHQIYVLSTARICEIYGQKEHNGDLDYVCTVRGGIITLPEGDSLESLSEPVSPTGLDRAAHVWGTIQDASSATGMVEKVYGSEESVAESPRTIHDSALLSSRGSEGDLFQSFTEAMAGSRTVGGSVLFDDQTDWIECPHSPMKSSAPSSDDEADNNKSGFYIIDADAEAQPNEQQRHTLLFTDVIDKCGDYALISPLNRSSQEAGGNFVWQQNNKENPAVKNSAADTPFPREDSLGDQDRELGLQETTDSLAPHLDEAENGHTCENLPSSYSSVFEADVECNCDNLATHSLETLAKGVQGIKNECSADSAQHTGDQHLFQDPVYECEVNLVNSDAWTSLTIRLLSIRHKSQVDIHRIVTTFTPGPPILPVPSSSREPSQQSLGSSSLLAMLVPGILQMARGLSEPRKGTKSLEREKVKSNGESSEQFADDSDAISDHLTLGKLPTNNVRSVTKETIPPLVIDKISNVCMEKSASYLGNLPQSDSHLTTQGETESSTKYDYEGTSESYLPRALESGGFQKMEGMQGKRLAEVHKNEDDRIGEVFLRLDRLETICLRMEGSLNLALENLDRRLKTLESGGVGRMPHPIWEPGFDSGSFVSASSVHIPVSQSGGVSYSVRDSQIPFSISAPVDLPVGESSSHCVSLTPTPFYPGLLSSTSPSLLSSVSSALPLYPLSMPQHISSESSTHSSGLQDSLMGKVSYLNQMNMSLHVSKQASNGGELYWDSRSPDDSDSDISSESEGASYAENCEDPGCECCPESVSSSPANPAQLVENALASALSAFSASFVTEKFDFGKEDEVYHAEDSDEDSFTSEEQAPSVDANCFGCDGEEEDLTHPIAEKMFTHDYEAIPLSKDTSDSDLVKVIQEDIFWSSENEENQQISWEDEGLQTQEEKIFLSPEDLFIHQLQEGSTTFVDSSSILDHTGDEVHVDDSEANNILPTNLEASLEKDSVNSIETEHSEGVSEINGQGLQQNPFLQELGSTEVGNVHGPQSAWLQDWNGNKLETAELVPLTYLNVSGFSKAPQHCTEVLPQEGIFRDECDWLMSEVSPFSSLMDVQDLSEDATTAKGSTLKTMLILEDISSNIVNGQVEPWSLLDEDVSRPSSTQQLKGDRYGKDGMEQKSQWSLLDDYPSISFPVDKGDLVGGHMDSPSLLDEDILIPFGDFCAVEQDAERYSSPRSLQGHSSISVVINPSKRRDALHSPSSQVSKSNPFDGDERLDLSQGTNNARCLLLEDFGEDAHDFETAGSEQAQSLLFHLSL